MRVQGASIINPKRNTPSVNRPSERKEAAADGADLSSVASELASAKDPEIIDMDRVERLRRAIRSGDFTIDADAIAERMLAEES